MRSSSDVGGQRSGANEANGVGSPHNGQQPRQMYHNAVVTQRTDHLVAGYLQRMGYQRAAQELSQESPFISNGNDQGMFLHDHIYDQTLESIIESIITTGGFGATHNLIDIKNQFRNLLTRLEDAATIKPCGQNIHSQLYGRPSSSRVSSRQSQTHVRRPAPQAIAAMNLQKTIEMAETRYQERNAQAAERTPIVKNAPEREVQRHVGFEDMENSSGTTEMNQELSQESQDRSSRRRQPQPRNYNVQVHNIIEPIVDYIGGRFISEIDGMNTDQLLDEFPGSEVLDYNILSHLDSPKEGDSDQRGYAEFVHMMSTVEKENEQRFDPSLIPVEQEVQVETEEIVEDVPHGQYHFPHPLPALSPVTYSAFPTEEQEKYDEVVDDQRARNIESSSQAPPAPTVAPTPSFTPMIIPNKGLRESVFARNSEREKKEDEGTHRKERRSDERQSSRNSPTRRKNDEKRRHEKERRDEKEKSRSSMSRDRRRRSRSRRSDRSPSYVKSPSRTSHRKSHRESSDSHRRKIQTDHESTSSRSVYEEEKRKEQKRIDKERKAAEIEKRKERERREKEKEKQKQMQKLQSQSVSNPSRDSSQQPVERTAGGSDRKRKADEVFNRDFKIPKKSGSYGSLSKTGETSRSMSHSQPALESRDSVPSPSPSISSPKKKKLVKSEKKKQQPEQAELTSGNDGPDRTRFFAPKHHIARLSSMLVNSDAKYNKFKRALETKDKRSSDDGGESAVSDIEEEEEDESSTPPTSMQSSSHMMTHPKGRSYAPSKGVMLQRIMEKEEKERRRQNRKSPNYNSDTEEKDDNADHEALYSSPSPNYSPSPSSSNSNGQDSPMEQIRGCDANKSAQITPDYSIELDDPLKISRMLDRIHK